jgi:hypothetical protein
MMRVNKTERKLHRIEIDGQLITLAEASKITGLSIPQLRRKHIDAYKGERKLTVVLTERKCSICEVVKPIGEYHRSKRSHSGHVSRCKSCTKVIQQKQYEKRADKERAYRAKYLANNPEKVKQKHERYRRENPIKVAAQEMVIHAIRRGEIKRLPCEVCGNEKTHGHHDDYAKPLEVRFLCAKHHYQWHFENGEAPNGK